MARTNEPNSATTHFFILIREAPHLDSKFAAFGAVTKGMEVVDAINQTSDITIDEYREISAAAQSDPQLMARISEIIEEMQPAQEQSTQ